MLFNEDNIIVLKDGATAEDLHTACNIFDKASQYDTYVFGGEFKVDTLLLNHEQKEEIREALGYTSIFSDGSGEPGDICLYFSGELELLDDDSLIVTGFTFITEDKNSELEDTVDNFLYATPHPTTEQVKNLILPVLMEMQ